MAFQDLFVYGMVLFAMAFAIYAGVAAVSFMQNIPLVNTNYTNSAGNSTINPYLNAQKTMRIFDWGFLLIAFGFAFSMFAMGLVLPSHPIFSIVGLVLAIFWVWFSPNLSNAFLDVISRAPFAGLDSEVPFITTIMLNLPLIGLAVGFLTAIFTYGKSQAQIGGF